MTDDRMTEQLRNKTRLSAFCFSFFFGFLFPCSASSFQLLHQLEISQLGLLSQFVSVSQSIVINHGVSSYGPASSVPSITR